MPLGVDIVEPPMLAALADEGITVLDGQQVMLDAREVKSIDEIILLNTACAMVDGAYQLISEQLKPGIRENELVANVTKFLFDLGSEHVDNINAVSGERCSPHPHVFSDRIIRPGDQAFFDIIHTFVGYKTCYYRTFVVGTATDAQRDAYKQAREWIDASIELMRPGVSTDQVASVWPKAQEFGFDNEMECFGLQFGHSVGLFLHERPIISRLNSLDHPVELKEGMVIALETYCPAKDGVSAARIEEEVVITADGPQVITRFPSDELFVANAVLGAPMATTAADIDRDTRLRMYRTMVECRFFEVRAQELFFEGLVRGTTHLGVGQEAVAAGVAAAMRPDDYTFCTYRGHNHTLARGVPMAPIFAELFGRATGLLGGKGGSMHLTSVEHGAMGSYAIVGAHLPIALGAAWSAQYRGSGQVVVLLLRRRHDQHRRLPRGAQHGRRLEGAGRLRVREQPVHGVHADPRRDRGGAPGRRPGVRLRPAIDPGRRQRRRRRPPGRPDGRRPGARRRRAVAHRGPDLPPRRPLARRPGQVPAGRGGRGLEGA